MSLPESPCALVEPQSSTPVANLGVSYLASMGVHLLMFIFMALVFSGAIIERMTTGEAVILDVVDVDEGLPPEIEFDIPPAPKTQSDEPHVVRPEDLNEIPNPAANANYNIASPEGNPNEQGDAGELAFGDPGSSRGDGLIGSTIGFGVGPGGILGLLDRTGNGGQGNNPLTGRGERKGSVPGGSKSGDRAVATALNWIAKHQNPNGSWSLEFHRGRCTDATCSSQAKSKSNAGATALALLPFLASGQTHITRGPYQKTIIGGLTYLVRIQKPNGDLSGGEHPMYAHGLATIAVCEAYGMTGDSRLKQAAQAALRFIETAQNNNGGWRYSHGAPDSDTSVVGWQVMALKSGSMAALTVDPRAFERARKGLATCAGGEYGGLFPYDWEKKNVTPAMTGVGLLCLQYLGANRHDPALREGIDYLMQHQPGKGPPNVYFQYYATQVLHNVQGADWETWNRAMRGHLVNTQTRGGCAEGSWSPQGDPWGEHAGRLFQTSLSCLTLEVYYRFLPLYQLEGKRNVLDNLDQLKK